MLKKILKYLVVFIVIIVIGIWFFVQHSKPIYKGQIKLHNLNDQVTIYYDNIWVPHIYAQNQKDVYLALGYVHAQDRLWQMELLRRISAGRLSEIFGKDMIVTDKLFLGLGIEEALDKIANYSIGK